jgi:tetratricopeptide (TPR) repeat protein
VVFGLYKIRDRHFILPTIEVFPYTNANDNEQFQKLFKQLCECFDVDTNKIIVRFFDDIKSKQWTSWSSDSGSIQSTEIHSQIDMKDQCFEILLAKSNLDHAELLVAVIAYELALFKLLDGNYVNSNDPDREVLRDLLGIYFGFGIFVANSVHTKDINWMTRTEYLPYEMISYTNALVCYITQNDANNYLKHFNSKTKELFKKDFEFLINTDDTELTKKKVSECELTYRIGKKVTEGFDQRGFDEVIEACKKLIKINPKNIGAFNSLGYSLLLQRKYKEAIAQFDKAIMINPYWDYPYNNRGYSKLQLGDLENALVDLESAYYMNSDNSFSWRNMGAYYLQINEYKKALEYFTQAEKMDPKTEMINFYLGHVYLKMGDSDKAKEYFDKSIKMDEYNDSILD